MTVTKGIILENRVREPTAHAAAADTRGLTTAVRKAACAMTGFPKAMNGINIT